MKRLWALWMHPQTQEVLGVVFVLLAVHNAVQRHWGALLLDIIVIFSAVQIIRGGK